MLVLNYLCSLPARGTFCFAPLFRLFAVMFFSQKVYIWSLQTGRLLDVLAGHEAPLSELAFSPSQGVLASASWDGTVKLWDVYKNECVEVHYSV